MVSFFVHIHRFIPGVVSAGIIRHGLTCNRAIFQPCESLWNFPSLHHSRRRQFDSEDGVIQAVCGELAKCF